MHSVAMPPLPAFLTIFSIIASPAPCCCFLPLTPPQSALKYTRYPDDTVSKFPSRFVSCSPTPSQPFEAKGLSRVTMWSIPLTPLFTAVQRLNLPNVSSSSRDLALATVLPARFPRRFFREKYPPHFAQFQVPTEGLAFVLPACWVQDSHHASAFRSPVLLLTRV